MSPSRGRRNSSSLLLAIATVTILHLIVWQSTSNLRTLQSQSQSHLHKRSQEEEPTTDALINWLKIYNGASNRDKPLVFVSMTIWLIFLFAFVGICASEFFCPNLSHIASRLGLSESVAGVTFLAFSNGSPDVFSTFSALKSNAGSLAIGELIGAASFIVSVVAGTMALISPFKVSRHTFLRDVGFFTVAVLLTLGILFDSHIHLWEALLMVGLYLVYVGYVAIGGFVWNKWDKKKRRELKARQELDHQQEEEEGLLRVSDEDEEEEEDSYTIANGAEIEWERPHHQQDSDSDEEEEDLINLTPAGSGTTTPLSHSSSIVSPRLSRPRPPHSHHSHSHSHYRSRSTSLIATTNPISLQNSISSLSSPSPSTTAATNTTGGVVKSIRPSLLGAIEFRDFVNSLNQERFGNASNLLSVFNNHPTSSSGGGGSGSKRRKKKGKGVLRPDHSRTSSITSTSSTGWGTSPDLNNQGGVSEWNWNGWSNNSDSLGGGGRRRSSSSPGFRSGQLKLDGKDEVLANGILNTNTTSIGSSSSEEEELEEEENPWKRQASLRVKKVPSILLNGKDTNIIIGESSSSSSSSSSSLTVKPTITSTSTSVTSPLSNSHLPPPPPSPTSSSESPLSLKLSTQKSHSSRILLKSIVSSLFPSLIDFSSKSLIGKITALMCVPALLVLNLTLPVAEEVNNNTTSQEDDDQDLCCSRGQGEEEEEEVEKEGVLPKGLKLPDQDENASLLRLSSDDDEEEGNSAVERVGRRLHSPAIAHPHSHHLSTHSHSHPPTLSHSHSLPTTTTTETLLTLEEGEPITSPWIDQQASACTSSSTQSPPSSSSTIEQHHFRVSSSGSIVNRVVSTSSDSLEQQQQQQEEEEEEETESLMLDRMECQASRKVTRGLTALQCLLGPIFCSFALFADELKWYQPFIAFLIGLFFSFLSWRYFHNPRHPGRVSLCFLGFGIAMVWILMIVNEVVGVLQTLGKIFGISDAILGLTIFAMGNSLGDLVANATVARMGYPSMAIAACFGGPMLNILLGVGLSGTYLILLSGPKHEPIHVEMGRTLMVSGIGLFLILIGSLIVVPLNRFRMTKRIGGFLIGAYTIVLTMNVITEIWW
ncbi:hypothetical protein JCM3765_000271 [Sporobolomyces pararoseus]